LFFHSYECYKIQTKNSFDEILNLSFDLETLKVKTKVNFAKDYQKDSYNKTHLIGEKLRG